MSIQTQRGFQRLLRPGRRSSGRPRERPSSHAVAAWMLFFVYVFVTACAVWDIVQPGSEPRPPQAASSAAAH